MTLTIQTAEDDKRQLTLTIEVDEARVQKAMQQKARELSREINLPGFRPGKAPYDVVVRRIGADTLRGEAVEDLVQPVFEEALSQADIDPYAQASLDDIQIKPLTLTFTVPLSPTVTLGDYRERRQELEAVSVSDEAVQEALEHVQSHHQVIETVERPAAEGDVVAISGRGHLAARPPAAEADAGEAAEAETTEDMATETEAAGDEVLFDEERLDILLDPKTLFPDTPFVENLVGLSVGDQKQFSITFPDPYEPEPDHAGREARFDVTILEVKKRELPPIDDELAKLDGRHETLDELRQALRVELTREAEDTEKERLIEEMTDYLLEDAQLVYPPAAIESQLDDMVEDFKNRLARSGWEFQDYLNLQGMTEESLREDFRENAENQLRHQLALRQFILDEHVRIDAADLEPMIEERVARFDNEGLRESLRNYYRSGQGLDAISGAVLSNKVYERIRAILSGEAPDLATLAAEAAEDEEE
ncbi:MAG: trigger factor [Candidatus Promineofilum sp.]|nr:trigger factor [Promineifilum sp.]MCW5863201.1 trigger factor [Anaerolineae bacterium]